MNHRIIEAHEFTAKGDDTWLFCIDCTRFFQHRDLRADTAGNLERCAFCDYAGFGFGIFPWDAFREGSHWPATDAELVRGATAPPPMNVVGPIVACRIGDTKSYMMALRKGAAEGACGGPLVAGPRPNRHMRRAMAKWMQ